MRNPDNPKYSQFKAENNVIKRTLVEVRGALEYAVAVSAIIRGMLLSISIFETCNLL